MDTGTTNTSSSKSRQPFPEIDDEPGTGHRLDKGAAQIPPAKAQFNGLLGPLAVV
jgi:hypothetical protein